MKVQAAPTDLATLRRLFGHRLCPLRQPNMERQIRPGRWRKISALREQWVSRATRQVLKKQLRPPEQIAKHVGQAPFCSNFYNQRDALIRQVCTRAACGDRQALNLLISTARGVVAALESLEMAQPANLLAAAETSSNWPVFITSIRKTSNTQRRNCADLMWRQRQLRGDPDKGSILEISGHDLPQGHWRLAKTIK